MREDIMRKLSKQLMQVLNSTEATVTEQTEVLAQIMGMATAGLQAAGKSANEVQDLMDANMAIGHKMALVTMRSIINAVD